MKETYAKPIFENEVEITEQDQRAIAYPVVVYGNAISIVNIALIATVVAVGGVAIGVVGPSCKEAK